ncbi:NAD-dependent epimerase/dehydratase family protein [Marinomonas shanghaiensis]|jgi:D-erythronate 2-dehydrogenase|uniref:NAD-dependent epimerase/dehydratase family protein n=1 Tax=Marinomonas shanghaiensis TaxID=2202418 RepID=UPI000DBA26CF|nr:NAD-dependent epimerase/dehydratase family protein [Marinomonas shanghaiensis]
MHVLITGANGFVGQALAKKILSQGCVGDSKVSRLTLLDRQFERTVSEGSIPDIVVEQHDGDLADAQWLKDTLERFPMDVIFHLASIPGGMAEKNDELGRRVNIDATMTLLEICKTQTQSIGRKSILVFASSIAVFGIMPDLVTDDTPLKPQMSYGAHKVVGEVMINDFSRRGWVDGRSLRLPGVLARPPAETGQLSAFLSDIIREVSQGHAFVCPMSAESKTWASSLPNIIENLLYGAAVEESKLKSNRTFTLPTLCFSMAEMVEALGLVYKQNANELVSYEPNPMIENLFGRFPLLETPSANEVGFKHDGDLYKLVERALL